MLIKITNLPAGIHTFEFEDFVNELQLGEPFVDKLILDCSLDKSQHQIVIKCNLTISTHLNCDRCNIDYKKDFKSKFTLLYLYEIAEGNDVNVKYLSPNDDKIDLTNAVVDYAKLAVPLKKLCTDECQGLCVMCGTNLNHNKCNCSKEQNDSVWEPLLNLKDKLK